MSRKNPWKQFGVDINRLRINQLRISSPFKSLTERAAYHERMRINVVGALLCHLNMINLKNYISRPENVQVLAATDQIFRGKKEDYEEAAHRVPGQLYVNHYEAGYLIPNPSIELEIRGLQAVTDVGPVEINKSDSRGERLGMRQSFWRASKLVVAPEALHGDKNHVNQEWANKGIQVYQEGVAEAYLAAEKELVDQLNDNAPNSASLEKQLAATEAMHWEIENYEGAWTIKPEIFFNVEQPYQDVEPFAGAAPPEEEQARS